MQRRALLAGFGTALGLAGCLGNSSESNQTREQNTPPRATSQTHRPSDTDTRTDPTTQSHTPETPTTNPSTETTPSAPTPDSRSIKLRVGYEAHFRGHFRGEAAPDGKQWLVVRYRAYNFGGTGIALAPADFTWVGENKSIDTPTGPVPYTYLGRRAYTESDSIYPDQSTTRSMTFAVPESATSQNLELNFRPPSTIEMYPTTLPDRRRCQIDEFDCKGL